ncbi:hypothetical protein S7711_03452 [Stachybotrys chartarum IBT 7711]|uniref:Zn(2)-C6 fungal-type domain-containing protein n=1 Tax=Stachybotrys chartarum (strain CBS 109288 / IBT 7711) TaxID=1280523 RepID=A0A084AFT0_STACB|nr:hypothetical protein S7711_03452 [Stachybotrys chartarum IBT 7711]
MPRPKIPPGQRQRVVEACGLCREAKKRCSGTAPCTYCLRRGVGDTCFTSHRGRARRSTAQAETDGDTITIPPTAGFLPNSNDFFSTEALAPTPSSRDTFRPISPSESRTTDLDNVNRIPIDDSLGSANVEASHKEPSFSDATRACPRMLRNLRGERVYIGEGASLSFLQLLRGIVADQIGPSTFSRTGRSDTMLENESTQSGVQALSPEDLSIESRMRYRDVFNSVTGGIIDPFAPLELDNLLAMPSTATPQQLSLANLVLAIGLQCDSSRESRDREMSYFRQAQSQAFTGMLEDPDVDMVRVFMIMSFYLLGECRRNTAFMYLGNAARAAVSLGLHSRETYTDMQDPQQQLRLRVWMSLRVLDIFVSSVLGRPAATAGIHSDMQSFINEFVQSAGDEGLICLSASYSLARLLSKAVDTLYDRKDVTIPAIEEQLRELEHWSRGLPEFLRTAPSSENSGSSSEKGAIGKVHVSCLYYFAVMLVTRPILIFSLTNQLPSGLVHSHLASACLDAASFIVQTCSGARRLKLLQPNMCILQAIIFPAGLVLGFESFAKVTVPYATEMAFHTARELLQDLSMKSPQSALYYDILTSLSNAISERRGRASSKGRSAYVSKLFHFERPEERQDDRPVGESSVEAPNDGVGGEMSMNDLFTSWSTRQTTPMGSTDVCLDWDTLDISLWDSFPYT